MAIIVLWGADYGDQVDYLRVADDLWRRFRARRRHPYACNCSA
jgi:hypothetical protein